MNSKWKKRPRNNCQNFHKINVSCNDDILPNQSSYKFLKVIFCPRFHIARARLILLCAICFVFNYPLFLFCRLHLLVCLFFFVGFYYSLKLKRKSPSKPHILILRDKTEPQWMDKTYFVFICLYFPINLFLFCLRCTCKSRNLFMSFVVYLPHIVHCQRWCVPCSFAL